VHVCLTIDAKEMARKLKPEEAGENESTAYSS
jgi:hypothetical protein